MYAKFLAAILIMSSLRPVLAAEGVPDPQANTALIEVQLQEARASRERNELYEARQLLERLAILAPDHQGVRQERALLDQLTGVVSPAGVTVTERAGVRDQLARVEIRVAFKRAEIYLANGDHVRALAAVRQAEVLLNRYPDADQAELLQQMVDLGHRAKEMRERDESVEVRFVRQDSQDRAIIADRFRQRQEEDVFTRRLSRVVAMMQRGNLRVALGHARQLVSDYPLRPQAEELFQKILGQLHDQRRLDTKQRLAEVTEEMRGMFHRALMPIGFDGQPIYPDGWEQRHVRDDDDLTSKANVSTWQQDLLDRLGTRVTVAFEDVRSIDALEMVARQAGIQMVIDTTVRNNNDVPVNFRVTNMRVDRVISWLTRQAGTEWRIFQEAVFIGDSPSEEGIIRLYDVAQLTYAPPDFPGPDLASMGPQGDGGGVFGTPGDGAFGANGNAMAPEDLVDVIRAAVTPREWDRADAGYGIQLRNGTQMIVTASPLMHTLIQEFIRSQSRAYHHMVHLEVRWLEVSDDFFEEIGINLSNAGGMLQAPNLGTTGAVRYWDTKQAVGNILHRLPGNAASISPTLISNGLQLQTLYLGALELSTMFSAVEQQNRGRVLHASELTTLSGRRANILFTTMISYMAGYNVGAGNGGQDNGAVQLDPTVNTLTVGNVFDVTPFVSADNKYITMDVRPYFSSVRFGSEGVGSTVATPGGPATLNSNIDLPLVETMTCATRVTVPDRGSVLIGGFDRNIEQHMKAQVPVLGSIPFIGRLFGARGRYSQRMTSYVTITAKIILLEEEEAFL